MVSGITGSYKKEEIVKRQETPRTVKNKKKDLY
jgi:hypothetical protein